MKTIEIVVSPAGETRVEVKGFSGSSCREATRVLLQALGQAADEQLKAEYFGFTHVRQPQQAGEGG